MPKELKIRDACRLLNSNGLRCVRSNGGHYIFSDGKRTISIPSHGGTINRMLMQRLIKENRLEQCF